MTDHLADFADYWASFIAWHERVIEQYPPTVQAELRETRRRWLATVRA